MKQVKWTFKMKFWRFLHYWFNVAAWKWNNPEGPDWGKALRIDHKRFWWRLNDWASSHYLPEWLEKSTGIRPKR